MPATADVMTPGSRHALFRRRRNAADRSPGFPRISKRCGSERCFRERKWRQVELLTGSRFSVKAVSAFISKKTIETFPTPFLPHFSPLRDAISLEIRAPAALKTASQRLGDSAKNFEDASRVKTAAGKEFPAADRVVGKKDFKGGRGRSFEWATSVSKRRPRRDESEDSSV